MQTRQLGTHGPLVSVIGFGAWPIGGQMGSVARTDAIKAILRSIELGSTLIDTAERYGSGLSEEIIGEAIKGKRDQVFLATKVAGGAGHLAYQRVLSACDASLKRLGTEYIDLYQCHWVDPQTPVEESMRAMDDLVKAGKVRHVGVSNFDVALLRRCLTVRHVDAIQPVYHLFHRDIEDDLIPFCRDHGIGILAYSPLAKGVLTGKYTNDTVFPADDERSQMKGFQGEQWRASLEKVDRLKALAHSWGISTGQLAIAWVLANPAVTVALVGAKSAGQVEENAGAATVTFSPEQLQAIDQAIGGYRAPLFG
ncbi:MAG TPA: aldo/keto reductase [Chloroflexota bacterium]|nr:aldo/keto reductase [Chloroflexota bacterium]